MVYKDLFIKEFQEIFLLHIILSNLQMHIGQTIITFLGQEKHN